MYAIASDGDIEEGINHEVASLAGHHRLGNLVVLYDNNQISIEDDTSISKSEDVCARYEAYGWHVQEVDWRAPGGYHEDVQALYEALLTAREHTEAPSLISLRTIIAWPAPNKQNTGAAHGAALGADEVAATKRVLDFDPEVSFLAEEEALSHTRHVADRAKGLRAEWETAVRGMGAANPERKELFDRLTARRLPDGWTGALPSFPPDTKGIATRKASGAVLTDLAPVLPELWGGSADLAESNLTTMDGQPSFIPVEHQTQMWPGNPYGRTMHFGIREHGMGAIIERHRAARRHPRRTAARSWCSATTCGRSVRLAALMKLPVTYVWTHDSVGLGEDGPTHQPVEHLCGAARDPGLRRRPARRRQRDRAWSGGPSWSGPEPAGLCLTRQAVPVLDRSEGNEHGLASAEGAVRGGYVLAETAPTSS